MEIFILRTRSDRYKFQLGLIVGSQGATLNSFTSYAIVRRSGPIINSTEYLSVGLVFSLSK